MPVLDNILRYILDNSGKLIAVGLVLFCALPFIYGGLIRLPGLYRKLKRKVRHMNMDTIRAYGFGGLIALLVLIACFVLWLIGKPLDAGMTLLLIGLLALARLT